MEHLYYWNLIDFSFNDGENKQIVLEYWFKLILKD